MEGFGLTASGDTHLLDAVADGLELIGKVLAAGVGGVEVRLDHHGETAAHDAVALTPAQRSLHARRTLVGHALHQTHVEANLIPLHHGPGDLEVRKSYARLPRLRRVEDQVVEGVADLGVLANVGVGEVVRDGVVLAVVLELRT